MKKEILMKKCCCFNWIFFPLLIMSFYGCSVIDVSRYPDGTNFVQDERMKKAEALPDVKFSIINTGEFYQTEGFLISSGSWLKKVNALLPCVLVQHPRGTILYDSGLGNNVERDFKEAMPWGTGFTFPYKPIGSARTQMIMSGKVNPDSIKTIIISHLHWDHASGIEDFPDAEIWTIQADYNYAIRKMGFGFSRFMFDNDHIKWRFIHFQDKPYENFDHSLDMFGDGSVVLVPLPGHTPSLIGMFINTKSGKRYFFINDASLFSDDLKVPAKAWMEKLFVDYDKKQTEATIAKIYRLMKQYPDMVIISSHDDAAKFTGKLFPKFME
jgi:glyoxylase-like metal-dependent hydrolase (beta-lactamase superfamily II)